MKLTWANAQQYCRANYDDLATIESSNDLSNAAFANSPAWIGLSDDPNAWKYNMGNESNSWRWSATGETSPTGYQNWLAGQPDNNGGHETCVLMEAVGQWNDVTCDQVMYFVCYSGKKRFALVYSLIAKTVEGDLSRDLKNILLSR